TMMIFFLDTDEKVYARYGGRDGISADSRQSLKGLHYTMQSVLDMHGRADKSIAPKSQDKPKYIREMASMRFGRCMHCHQVRETLNSSLRRTGQWTREHAYRYPLPENLGLTLEVDRGNIVKSVKDKSPAAELGLKPGDVVKQLADVPGHSFGDAQSALDKAPASGTIEIAWQRGAKMEKSKLTLPEGWRRSDLSWRPSLRHLTGSARLFGPDLTADEKKALRLSPKALAFRQKDAVSSQAKAAGIRGGDIIVGIDEAVLEKDAVDFLVYVQNN